jgi:peptidoglycan/LPS O-acetylase OafA/YrhL
MSRVTSRLPGIEGLRGVAATAVLVQHCWQYGGGDGARRVGAGGLAETVFLNLALGVTLFFTLSGFLLYRPFAAAIARRLPRPSFRAYARNRGLRIVPAYLVILLLCAFVLQTTLVRDRSGEITYGALADPLDVLRSALLLQDYAPSTMLQGIGPAWSLAVEVVFYVLLPFLVLLAGWIAPRLGGGRGARIVALLVPPALLLLVGLSGKYAAAHLVPGPASGGWDSDWHSVVVRSFWAQADLFAFGMAAAILHTEIVDGRVRLPRWWRGVTLLAAGALGLACAARLDQAQLGYPLPNTAAALAMALLLLGVAVPTPAPHRPTRLQALLGSRTAVTAGLISYSVFLWNEPVVQWLARNGLMRTGWVGFAGNLALTLATVGVLSALTYRFVEAPALRRKRRTEPPPLTTMDLAAP